MRMGVRMPARSEPWAAERPSADDEFVAGVNAIEGCPDWGCGAFLGLLHAAIPRSFRYSRGLRPPSEILIRFSLYHRM